jgi:hypothetical protein
MITLMYLGLTVGPVMSESNVIKPYMAVIYECP